MPRRTSVLALAPLVAAVLALLALAAQDAAAASPATGHPYRHGVVPRREASNGRAAPLPWNSSNAPTSTRRRHAATTRASSNLLSYGGAINGVGVTTGAPQVYIVFWGSQWGGAGTPDARGFAAPTTDPVGLGPDLIAFYENLSNGQGPGWSGVMSQYCEGISAGSQSCPSTAAHVGMPSSGGPIAGVWVDTSAAAPSSANGNQLAQEAIKAAAHFGNTTAASNRNAQYVVVSPHGTNPDNYESPIYGYCAWHDYSTDSSLTGGAANSSSVGGPIAFTNLPYLTDVGSSCGQNFVNSGSAGTLDGVTIVGGHEYAETITDQYPAGGWTDASGNENGDKCAWITPGQPGGSGNLNLGSRSFAVQTTWSNDGAACDMSHAIVTSGPSLKIQGLASSFTAGGSPSGTVQLVDASGNPTNAPSSITVSLSSTGSGTFGSPTVTIPAGSSSSNSFTYNDTKAESTVVTASASGYGSGTQNESVAAGPAATLAISPQNQTVPLGGGLTLTASASDQYGNPTSTAQTSWATQSPATVTPATGSSTTFSSGTAGSYSVSAMLNGVSATTGVTVSTAAAVIANGSFENAFTGWVTGGGKPTPTVSTTQAYAGTHSALLGWTGSTGEPSGDSTIQQTFTVPAAGGTLSFNVWEFSTDTVRYDWQTCQLRNTSGGTLATIFKEAGNGHSWITKSYSLNNWKSQKISVWCNVHEDGWGDQTYMYVDNFQVK